MEPAHKGTGLVIVRRLVREIPAGEARLLDRLSRPQADLYRRFTASDWLDLEFASTVYEQASILLFPGDDGRLRTVGKRIADDSIRQVHRFLLRLTTVPFLITQAARLWSTFHRTGAASVASLGPRRVRLEVVDYPALTQALRLVVGGYVQGLLDASHARNISVQVGGDLSCWTWTAVWDD